MNIYENMIENVNAKKAKTNAVSVLEKIKTFLEQLENKIVYGYSTYEHEREKMNASGYSAAFIQEWEEKEKGKYEQTIKEVVHKFVDEILVDFKKMKDSAMICTGDKIVSTNNLLKLQTILPSMTDEDKRKFFEFAADKDPSVLEVLYFNVKESDTYLASEILEKINQYTAADQISIVEKELEQLKELYAWVSYDIIKNMGDGFSQIDGIASANIKGTTARILGAFVEEIDKKIEFIKNMEN